MAFNCIHNNSYDNILFIESQNKELENEKDIIFNNKEKVV